jgi:peptide/nickel transport system substrate-binding protein
MDVLGRVRKRRVGAAWAGTRAGRVAHRSGLADLGLPCVAAIALGVLSACTSSPPEFRTLVVGRAADAVTLDPALVSDSESVEVCEQIFEHLLRFRKGGLEVEPALAESWQALPSGKEWIFHLRRNVRFHDDTPFNADAVVFSFRRQHVVGDPQGGNPGYHDSTFRNVRRVEKVDEYTVRIVLDRPSSSFLPDLALFTASIVSPQAVEQLGADFARHPVGTGPFRFVEWSLGERITLAANPSYWGGAPRIEHLVFSNIPDPRQRLVALEGGAIDVAEGLEPEDLQFVALHPELRTKKILGNNVAYVAINTEHPPFNDVRVRRAINHAVNRQPIVKLIYQGLAEPASGPLAPTFSGTTGQPAYAYDPARARGLLAEAKYDTHLRPKFYVLGTARPFLPEPERLARLLASHLRAVGIDVELVFKPISEFTRAIGNGDHDLALYGWIGDSGEPSNFLYVLFDGDNAQRGTATNAAFFRDPRLHELLMQAEETGDAEVRTGHYAEALRLIHDQAPWLPLVHAEMVVAERSRVMDLDVSPAATLYFREVWLDGR